VETFGPRGERPAIARVQPAAASVS
jgi:hypothetical protein